MKKGVFGSFTIFTGKTPVPESLWHTCFPVDFGGFEWF